MIVSGAARVVRFTNPAPAVNVSARGMTPAPTTSSMFWVMGVVAPEESEVEFPVFEADLSIVFA